MSKSGYQSSTSRSQYTHKIYQNSNNYQSSLHNQQKEFKEYEIDSDFYEDFNPSPQGHIIHHSTQRSVDELGNHLTKAKIVRELNESNTIKNNATLKKQNKKESNRSSKYTSSKNETDRQKSLYLSPDIKNGSSYDSPLFNNREEIGVKTNYVFETKKINGKSVGTYSINERYEYINKNGKKESKYEKSSQGSPSAISPLGYMENYSSGSELDENQLQSFENYPYSIKTMNTNKTNYNKNNKFKKNEKIKINYEIEEPEMYDYLSKNKRKISNDNLNKKSTYHNNKNNSKKKVDDSYTYTSEIKDFQSPERKINESKKFRKVNMEMISSKGPTNEDIKISNVMTKEIVDTKKKKSEKTYTNEFIAKRSIKNCKYSNDHQIRIEAAKIIQAWWRSKNFREEDVYDITVTSAIKLQSFIRGFLVRKKVLRYITLAIYYQSFCDKLQDVLCNYVKNIIFNMLKEKFLIKKKTKKITKDIIYKRKQILISIIENIIEKNIFYVINILQKWKEIAYKIKNKTKIKEKNKDKEIAKKIKTKSKTNYNINKSVNNISNSNISSSQNMYIKEVKVKTVRNSAQQGITVDNYQSKPHQLTKSITTYHINTQNKYLSPKSSNTKITYKIKNNPNTYSSKITTKVKRKTPFSPHPREKSTEKKYQIDVNKSYGTFSNYKKDIEKIKYTTFNETLNHKTFTRVDKSKEKQKKTSPEFGTLRKSINTKESNTTQKNIEIVAKKKTYTNLNKNKVKKSYNAIDTSKKKTTKIVKNKYTKADNKKIQNKCKTGNANKIIAKKEIISKGTSSIVKIPKRRSDSSFSRESYFYEKEKRSKSTRNSKSYNTYTEYDRSHMIDNQLSVSIIKLNNEEKEDKLNKTTIQVPEKIRIKEKLIIQKEMEPETAEEAIGFQIFDMKICRRVSLLIEPSTELRQKIINEKKELEIFKKREREKSKEIEKFKKDIEMHKLKSLLDSLRRAIRTSESFKKRISHKKFNQYRRICANKPLILEIDPMDDWEIRQEPKKKRDFGVQKYAPKEKKVTRNFKVLKISKIIPVTYIYYRVEKPQKVTKTKLNILSQIKKRDQSQQSESWNKEISPLKNNNINYISSKKKSKENSSQYYKNNIIDDWKEIEFLRNKPEMIDDEVQHEYEENFIEAESLEILRIKPKFKNSSSQYEKDNPKISEQRKFSIINKNKVKKKETKEVECNTVLETVEQGVNAVEKIEPKPKNVEIKLRTVKRSLTKMQIPLLKKLWLRKAFRTFRDNCQRPPFHLILERELLRMAFLRWRFVRGYGPDRYGNCYDRDGNLLYKTRGKVADFETQNEEIKEKYEQSTQYTPIENVVTNMKYIEIGPSYKKVIKKETRDQSVGNNTKISEKIQRRESFHINQSKKKEKNKISKNNFVILKKNKVLRDKQTQSAKIEVEIDKMDDFEVIDDKGFVKKKKNTRLKDLLIQILYRREISDKLTLSEALRNWLKQSLILMHLEEKEIENERRMYSKIKKSDRFSLIEKKSKEEAGTQMAIAQNKIQNTTNVNLLKNIKKKNAETSVNFPSEFDYGKIKPKKEKNMQFESTKKKIVLKTNKENTMNIYGKDYLFKEEIRRGIHHEMTEEARERVMEILYNFFMARGDLFSLLRKYFTIWHRKSNYLTLIYNARIISHFCKRNLYNLLNARKWQKMGQRLLLKEKIKLIKLAKDFTYRINKIFDLIRITRVNSVFSRKRYIHFIIIAWLAYCRNINNKRTHVQSLYENMINTYMNVADDIFGNNQKQNPSVQDAFYEAIESTKFQTKKLQDVPIANDYYQRKKNVTKYSTNIIWSNKNEKSKEKVKEKENYKDIETKKYSTYKNVVSNYPVSSSTKVYVNEKKVYNDNNRYTLINKYKKNTYKKSNNTSTNTSINTTTTNTKINTNIHNLGYKSINETKKDKNQVKSDYNERGRSYKIKIENSEIDSSNSRSKMEKDSTYRYRNEERSKSKGNISYQSDSEGKRSESKGKSTYKYRKEERTESKGNISYRSDSEGNLSESKGKNINTYKYRKEERSESKDKGGNIYKSIKIEKSDSKGRIIYRSEKEEKKIETKRKYSPYRISKEDERDESRGRKSYRSEKSERSESRKSKGYVYQNEEDIDSNIEYNNHQYYESKKVVKREKIVDNKNKNGNIISIKSYNIRQKKGFDENSKNEISINNDNSNNDNSNNDNSNNEEIKESRKLSYGERRKLFRKRFQRFKNNEE